MNQFQRFARWAKGLFATQKSNPEGSPPAGAPPKETCPSPEAPPPAETPQSEESEPTPVSVASAESAEDKS